MMARRTAVVFTFSGRLDGKGVVRNKRQVSASVILISLILASCAVADSQPDFSVGVLDEDPFLTSFNQTKAAAVAGDTDAELALGAMYQAGKGTEPSVKNASGLFLKASEKGNARAALLMAQLEERRNHQVSIYVPDFRAFDDELAPGVDDDPMSWLKRSAEAGLGEAEGLLAAKLPDNTSSRLEWARKAADQGDAIGLFVLGEIMTNEQKIRVSGIDSEEVRLGFEYLSEASSKFAVAGTLYLSRKYREEMSPRGQGAQRVAHISSKERDMAFRVDLEEVAYLDAPPDAPFLILGQFIQAMDFVVTGYYRSFDEVLLADGFPKELANRALRGDTQSACNLGFLLALRKKRALDRGNVDHQQWSLTDPFPWYETAAKKGAARAEYWLGRFYRNRRANSTDADNALKYLYFSAKQGFLPAQAEIGDLILNGEGTSANPIIARAWLMPAAAADHPLALFDLGRIYFEGLGVAKDETRGLALIRRAATNDYGVAARDWLKARVALGQQFEIPRKLTYGPNPDAAKGGCN